jgi:hypothetical protein
VLSVGGEACARFAPASDPAAFAAAVREVLANPALAAQLAETGSRLRDKYSLAGMVDAYVALLARHGIAVRESGIKPKRPEPAAAAMSDACG